MTSYEVPLSGSPQTFAIKFTDTEYRLSFVYLDTTEGGWTMNIADTAGVPMVSGIPLVTGYDLLEQYRHLEFGVSMIVQTDVDLDAVPTFDNLGTTSHLYVTVA